MPTYSVEVKGKQYNRKGHTSRIGVHIPYKALCRVRIVSVEGQGGGEEGEDDHQREKMIRHIV